MALMCGGAAALNGRGLRELAGRLERARAVSGSGLGGQAGDLAGVAFEAFQHGQHGQGMAAAMARATRSGWAWATLPPIEAAVPQPTSSHP